MTRVTEGIMRTVYLTKRYAIKIPSYRHGWRMFVRGLCANLGEIELWKRWHKDTSFVVEGRVYADMLCPVLRSFMGGLVVVMPRVRIVSESEVREIREYKTSPYYPVFDAFNDSKPDNFGWLNGKVVCVDYGGDA